MEKIDTDYKQRTWKIQAELFKMRKRLRSSQKNRRQPAAYYQSVTPVFFQISLAICRYLFLYILLSVSRSHENFLPNQEHNMRGLMHASPSKKI